MSTVAYVQVEKFNNLSGRDRPLDIPVIGLLHGLLCETNSPHPEIVTSHKIHLWRILSHPKAIRLSLAQTRFYERTHYHTLPFEIINPKVFFNLIHSIESSKQINILLDWMIPHIKNMIMMFITQFTNPPNIIFLLLNLRKSTLNIRQIPINLQLTNLHNKFLTKSWWLYFSMVSIKSFLLYVLNRSM